MEKIHFEEILPYSAADLYGLVMDIEKYPEIFNDISKVRVTHVTDNERSVDVSVRTPTPMKNINYSCNVTGTPPNEIKIQATTGAFKSMNATWRFDTQPDGKTKVSYDMEFDFKNVFFNAVAGWVIDKGVKATKADMISYAQKQLTPVTDNTQQPAEPKL